MDTTYTGAPDECSLHWPEKIGQCPCAQRPLNSTPDLRPVGQPHKLREETWLVGPTEKPERRVQKWKAHCTCGARSDTLTTAGMMSGWYANHLEQVAGGSHAG